MKHWHNIKQRLLFFAVIAVSVFVLFFVICCSWIRFDVKSQCQNAKRELLDKVISQYKLKKAINLTSGGLNIAAWTWRGGFPIRTIGEQKAVKETIVVSHHLDPYYRLAQKIAKEEGLDIVEELEDVLQFSPTYIILVSSPNNLTKERLSDIGHIFKSKDYYPALGIISGSTLEKAEHLWARGNSAKEGNNYVGGDTEVFQEIYTPTIFNITDGKNKKIALNKKSLVEVLKQADYFYWARHTAPTNWFWNEAAKDWGKNDELFSKDIPPLKPLVVYSPTCSVFRPWVKNSIALGFVDKGAAAYLGFLNSPANNAFLKQGLFVPGLTSWKEFPLGLVAQIQNKSATKTFFTSPQFFMLGDPRIYLSKNKPYHIVSDTVDKNGKRTINGTSGERGVLAIKINNAAKYNFLTIKGTTSVSENDLFYNGKVQTLNLGTDKYILYLHQGGHFQIELSKESPFGWVLTDGLIDALDYSWVVLWVNVLADDNPYIYVISLPIFIGILLFKIFKQKKSLKDYRKIFLVAFLLTFLRLGYCWLRLDNYSVSVNPVNYTAIQILVGCIGVFSGVAGGLMLMRDTKKTVVIFFGLLFAVLRQFWLTGFYFVFLTLLNNATQVTGMTEAWQLNYNSFWLSFIVLVLEVFIILVSYRYVISNKSQNEKK